MIAPAIIARREIKDTVSDWRVVTPMLVLAVLVPIIIVAGIRLGIPIMDRIDPTATTEKLIPFGAMMAAFFPISFSLVVALESFVGEKERNTLESLLVMPLSDAELFLGKFLAVIIPPTILATLGLLVFSLGLWLVLQATAPADFLVLALLLSLVKALAMVAGAVVVSSQTTSVRAANLLASFIILPMALVMQGEVLLVLTGRGHLLWLTLLALVIVAAILLRMGIHVFNREEILARESDQIRFDRMRDLVVSYWRQTPRAIRADRPTEKGSDQLGRGSLLGGLRRLYLVDIPQLLSIHRFSLLVAGLISIGFGVLGYQMAFRFPLDLDFSHLRGSVGADGTTEALAGLTSQAIFLHNLEIIALTALLGAITFGVGPLVILGAPFAVIGFFAGQAALNGVHPATFLLAFIVPHGLVEMPAILLASAFGLNLGLALMAPPARLGFGGSLLLAAVEWLKIAWLLVPLFALAAWIEIAVTPRVVALVFGG